FGPGGEPGRVIVAPPSSHQRAIHLPALPAPRRHAALVVIHVTNRTTAPACTSQQAVLAAPRRPHATRAPGKVAPTDTTRPLAAETAKATAEPRPQARPQGRRARPAGTHGIPRPAPLASRHQGGARDPVLLDEVRGGVALGRARAPGPPSVRE